MITSTLNRLRQKIEMFKRVAVAYSGGVDSTLLLKIALDCLGKPNVLAVMVSSPLVSQTELDESAEIAANLGSDLRVIKAAPLQIEKIARNQRDRCFFCKEYLLGLITDLASVEGYEAVVEGSNVSDIDDYRPGMEAVRKFDLVRSPFIECGVTKMEIRTLARSLSLDNWNKPSQACLASRFPYGTRLEADSLAKVAAAEHLIKQMGIKQIRVRYHGDLARIEISPKELPAILNKISLSKIADAVKPCGFTYVALDLDGYRPGSMNEALR